MLFSRQSKVAYRSQNETACIRSKGDEGYPTRGMRGIIRDSKHLAHCSLQYQIDCVPGLRDSYAADSQQECQGTLSHYFRPSERDFLLRQ